MTRQTNYADVVSQVFSTELCTQANFVCFVQQLLFKVNVAEGTSCFVASSGQVVVVLNRGQLNSEQILFSTCATNNKCNVVGRTSGSTQALHLFNQEGEQSTLILNSSLGHGVEVSFVSRATTFGHHYKAIFIAFNSFNVNLSRQVATCVHLVVHVERCIL